MDGAVESGIDEVRIREAGQKDNCPRTPAAVVSEGCQHKLGRVIGRCARDAGHQDDNKRSDREYDWEVRDCQVIV